MLHHLTIRILFCCILLLPVHTFGSQKTKAAAVGITTGITAIGLLHVWQLHRINKDVDKGGRAKNNTDLITILEQDFKTVAEQDVRTFLEDPKTSQTLSTRKLKQPVYLEADKNGSLLKARNAAIHS